MDFFPFFRFYLFLFRLSDTTVINNTILSMITEKYFEKHKTAKKF